jgi:hypothetical protein
MTNQEKVNSILAMDDDLAKVESITDGMPVDDYSPEDNKELTLDDIFGVNTNDQPQTFGDSFAPLGDDTKTEEGRQMITQAFVSELNKLPDQKIEIADIPAIAATVQMRTGATGDVESFLANTVMQTVNTLAEQNKTELNPDGAVSEMAKETQERVQGEGPAVDQFGNPTGNAATGPLPEVPPLAPTPEPSLPTEQSAPVDDINGLLPPDDVPPADPNAAGTEGDGTLGLADIGVSDDDLAAANSALDNIDAAPAADAGVPEATDTAGLDNALAGLDKLDDNMFSGDGAGEAAGTDASPAPETPAPEGGEPAATEPAADDTKPEDDKDKDGAKVESANDDSLPPMLESALDTIHSEYVAKTHASEDAAAAQNFVRSVAAMMEAKDKKAAAMAEAAAGRRAKADAIMESVINANDRKAMLENAAKSLIADRKSSDRAYAMTEGIIAKAGAGMKALAQQQAMVESATAAHAKAAENAATKLQGELNSLLESADAPKAAAAAQAPMVESAAQPAPKADPVAKRTALIESIVDQSAQSRLSAIRDRVQQI